MPNDVDDLRQEPEEILPKSQHKKIDRILELLDPADVYAVAVHNTHAGIEMVEAYGLKISVDANGYAAEIEFPDGAVVLS